MSSPVAPYLVGLATLRASGGAVKETSYYPPLAGLLDAVGATLSPAVRCVGQLKNFVQVGSPDFGLYSADQFPRKSDLSDPPKGLLPARGVMEVKGTGDEVDAVAASAQVAKYLQAFGLVLVTNYRDFLLVSRGPGGAAHPGERYRLADDEKSFWDELGRNPARLANRHAVGLEEFLRRALLHEAPLSRPQDVAFFLASYARHALRLLDERPDLPALQAVRDALQEGLGIRFDGKDGEHFFRSTLVQTLFYGVFSAWVLWCREPHGPGERFRWREAAWSLHLPILRKLFEMIATPGQLKPLGLDELLDWTDGALARVDRPAFFASFDGDGADGAGGDAVQYFYEPFLEAFDPALRRQLGVWYTPREIVRYQVARADRLLRDELGVPDGLADPGVYVLDPCCGTGAYLVETLRRVEHNLRERGDADALLASDLKAAARDRLFGFELIPAPFVIAHLQMGLMLARVGAPLGEDERAAIFLTNALTGWEPPAAERAPLLFSELEAERTAAEEVKRFRPILVILGNPPYNGFAGLAVDEERDLSDAYRATRPGLPAPQGQGLNDLYVRFFRMAERRIAESPPGRGIVSFISNYSWLTGLSHPTMRNKILKGFDQVWIDNLHGDRMMCEIAPDGRSSNTIFAVGGKSSGIKIGTAIATLVRRENNNNSPCDGALFYRDFDESSAAERRATLLASAASASTSTYVRVIPNPALGLPLTPIKVDADYLLWPRLNEIFAASSPGVNTSRDHELVDIDLPKLKIRIEAYFDPNQTALVRSIAPGLLASTQRFDAEKTREVLMRRGIHSGRFIRFAYRPFDNRFVYWHSETKLLDEKREPLVNALHDGNLFLCCRQKGERSEEGSPFYVASVLADRHLTRPGSACFPRSLIGFGKSDDMAMFRANLSSSARVYLSSLGISNADESDEFFDVLWMHALAVGHSHAYLTENAGALRQDWPRIPLPTDRDALLASAALGRRVAALLDPETPVPGVTAGNIDPSLRRVAVLTRVGGGSLDPAADLAVTAGWGHFGQGGSVMPGRGRLSEYNDLDGGGLDEDTDGTPLRTGPDYYRVFLNERACWDGVRPAVWEYTLGGYPVLKKWLSYREQAVLGRALRPEEAREFTAIARRIAALLALGPDLDASYHAAARSAAPDGPAPDRG